METFEQMKLRHKKELKELEEKESVLKVCMEKGTELPFIIVSNAFRGRRGPIYFELQMANNVEEQKEKVIKLAEVFESKEVVKFKHGNYADSICTPEWIDNEIWYDGSQPMIEKEKLVSSMRVGDLFIKMNGNEKSMCWFTEVNGKTYEIRARVSSSVMQEIASIQAKMVEHMGGYYYTDRRVAIKKKELNDNGYKMEAEYRKSWSTNQTIGEYLLWWELQDGEMPSAATMLKNLFGMEEVQDEI